MIALKVKEMNSFREKITGLIGKKKVESILIKTRFGIHTFGLKFPIDILILDKEYNVQYMRENLSPNKIFFWNPLYNLVLELPLGFIKKNKIKIGDSLFLDFS